MVCSLECADASRKGKFIHACSKDNNYSTNWCRNIDRMEWLLNAAVIQSEANTAQITLTINEPRVMNGGQYSCVVHFFSGTPQEAIAGFLVIYSEICMLASRAAVAICMYATSITSVSCHACVVHSQARPIEFHWKKFFSDCINDHHYESHRKC